MNKTITIETIVNAPVEKVWEAWTQPEHVTKWNHASDDWHSPRGENDLKAGGKFNFRMEARDGSVGFDFTGTYDKILPNELIAYTLDDGRGVTVDFIPTSGGVKVVETFEMENENSEDMQRSGWQAILDNFKKYVESL